MTFKITYESIRTEVSSYIYIYILIDIYILYTSYKNLLRALPVLAKRSNVLNVHASVSEVRLYARIYY